MNKITFIIPTIGRKTLINSLQSLISQDNPNWCAIVIFDGVSKNITSNIIYILIKKLAYQIMLEM
jgi:glycosyltransferase involved in cell wall biosynthesis